MRKANKLKKEKSNKPIYISLSILLFLTFTSSGMLIYKFTPELFASNKQGPDNGVEDVYLYSSKFTVDNSKNDNKNNSSNTVSQSMPVPSKEGIISLFEYYASVNNMTVIDKKETQKSLSERADYLKTASVDSLIVTVFIPKNIEALSIYYDAIIEDIDPDMKSKSGYTEKIEMIDGVPYYRMFFNGNGYIIFTAAEQEDLAEHAISYMKEHTEK